MYRIYVERTYAIILALIQKLRIFMDEDMTQKTIPNHESILTIVFFSNFCNMTYFFCQCIHNLKLTLEKSL